MVRPRRTQIERRRETEDRLLQAAIELIASEGLNALTFESLSVKTGLSRGLASQRFGSKQELVEALLLHLHNDQAKWQDAKKIQESRGLDFVLEYVSSSLSMIGNSARGRAYFILLSSAVVESSGREAVFSRLHDEVKMMLERWFVQGQKDGSIRLDLDRPATAMLIGCMLFGASMQALIDQNLDMPALSKSCLQLLGRSLSS